MNKFLLIGFIILCFTSTVRAEAPNHKQVLEACNEKKIGEACWAAAYSYEGGKDLNGNDIGQNLGDSAKYYKTACELGEPKACLNLGNNLLSGMYSKITISESTSNGMVYYRKGCE